MLYITLSDINYEQRCAIKFCVKLGHSATETFTKLTKVYGDEALSRAQISDGLKCFQMVGESIKDDPRSGRPLTSRTDNNVDRIKDLVWSDH